jgi:hypothetical protein
MDDTAAPLILTLAMDDASFERFDALRREHFPPDRNLIPAHLTLFHHLPGGEREGEVAGVVGDACRMYRPMTLRVTGLKFMGRGVAYTLESPSWRGCGGCWRRSGSARSPGRTGRSSGRT